jgi:hypothetical protein
MAMFYDGALKLLSSNPADAAILMVLGFLFCHLIHAIVYGFVGFGNPFDKIKKFIKGLLFIYK